MDGGSEQDFPLMDGMPMADGVEVCDGCFLECEKAKWGFPCSLELRKWAREHRYETDYYYEEP